MAERMLFLPGWFLSPGTCEAIPGIHTALEDLRKRFKVDIFSWPWVAHRADMPPTWQGSVHAIIESLTPETHVVCMGAATGQLLMALGKMGGIARSCVCAGFSVPPATLRSLNMPSQAVAAAAMFRWRSSYQYMRLVMEDADEEHWNRLAALADADIDWATTAVVQRSLEDLDLEEEQPRLTIPALYLDSPLTVSGFAEMTEVFRRYAPAAAVQQLSVWPGRLHDQETGRDLSQKVLAFIQALPAA
ncbi:MAG: hypothetical protein WEB00_01410 [Dehalococcoidia bacterium]